MKPFTDTQKKWAMASALLLVLGFNVSFNSQSGGLASLDLASESADVVPGKITTSKGVANVKYIKTGEKEVLALVPKVEEGSYCEKCGYERYTLSVAMNKNTDDIDNLNVALLKKIEAEKAKPEEVAAEEKPEPKSERQIKKEKEESDREKKIAFTQKKLDALDKECRSEDSEKFNCYSEGLADLLRSFDDSKLDQKTVQAFVKGKVLPQAKAELNATTRSSIVALKIQAALQTGMTPDAQTIMEYNTLKLNPNDAAAQKEAVVSSMANLVQAIPSQFEDVRKQFVVGQTALLQDEANAIQQQRVSAASNPSNINAQNDALARTILLEDLQKRMGVRGQQAIYDGVAADNISENMVSPYLTYFQQMATNPFQTTSGTTINVPSNTVTANPSLSINAGLAARLNAGRGIGANRTVTNPSQIQSIPTLPNLPGLVIPNTTGIPTSPVLGGTTGTTQLPTGQIGAGGIPTINSTLAPASAVQYVTIPVTTDLSGRLQGRQ